MTAWPTHSPRTRPLLGANGTEAMGVLLARGDSVLVDYLKVGPFMGLEAVAALAVRFPLMLHLDDVLSGPLPVPDERLRALQEYARVSQTPWTSEHLGFSVASLTINDDGMVLEGDNRLEREASLERIVANARAMQEALGVPILLENVPLYPSVAHLNIVEPDYIAEALDRSGCDLLLDLAHARVTASMLEVPPEEYLAALPLERVRELHLSGPRPINTLSPERLARMRADGEAVAGEIDVPEGALADVHEPMGPEDYALLAWTLARCRPRAVSLEYYRDPDALKGQLVRLGQMLGRPTPG